MNTQNLKNVVIVPRGAKGAFIIRETFDTPAEQRAAADSGYKIFINGLLQVTDNLVDDKIVAPKIRFAMTTTTTTSSLPRTKEPLTYRIRPMGSVARLISGWEMPSHQVDPTATTIK